MVQPDSLELSVQAEEEVRPIPFPHLERLAVEVDQHGFPRVCRHCCRRSSYGRAGRSGLPIVVQSMVNGDIIN